MASPGPAGNFLFFQLKLESSTHTGRLQTGKSTLALHCPPGPAPRKLVAGWVALTRHAPRSESLSRPSRDHHLCGATLKCTRMHASPTHRVKSQRRLTSQLQVLYDQYSRFHLCVFEDLVLCTFEKQNKTTLFKVTEPSSVSLVRITKIVGLF